MNKVIIESEKLQHNIDVIKEKVKSVENSPIIIAVLKANCYGMDAILVAKKLIDNGISFFAVSTIEEAKTLRDNGFDNDILLLESTEVYEDIEEIVRLNIISSIGSKISAQRINEVAIQNNKIVNAHLKIDTGFSRYGFISENGIDDILDAFKDLNNIKITGTYSHFCESYFKDSKTTKKQFDKFMTVVEKLKKENFQTGILHICNSSAFFKYPGMYLDAVRIGSAFTGRLQITDTTGLQGVGYLESKVSAVKKINKGAEVGYSRTEKMKKDTEIAIIEAGYADGVGVMGKKDSISLIDKLRLLKNSCKYNKRIFVEINDKRFPVIGRIGMKNMIADVTNANVNVGDKVKIKVNLVFVDSNIIRSGA